MVSSPNKVGFDSLESAMAEPRTDDIKNFDILQQSSIPLKHHGATTQSNLMEENKAGMMFEDMTAQFHSNHGLIQKNGG